MTAPDAAGIPDSRSTPQTAGQAAYRLMWFASGVDVRWEDLGTDDRKLWDDIAQAAIDWWHADRDLEPSRAIAAAAPAGTADPLRCPACGSPEPRLHPAVSGGGEVTRICADPFHGAIAAAAPAGTAEGGEILKLRDTVAEILNHPAMCHIQLSVIVGWAKRAGLRVDGEHLDKAAPELAAAMAVLKQIAGAGTLEDAHEMADEALEAIAPDACRTCGGSGTLVVPDSNYESASEQACPDCGPEPECLASHCPPSATVDCEYPKCAPQPQPAPELAAAMAALMDEMAANYPEDVFPASSDSRDAISGTAMRHAYRTAARLIRERTGDQP